MTEIDLEALAAKVEALEGPCRETDAEIHTTITGKRWRWAEFGGMPGYEDQRDIACEVEPDGIPDEMMYIFHRDQEIVRLPTFTASLDAAMALVPEGMDWIIDNFDGPVGRRCSASINSPVKGWSECHAATPALALTAAALRARLTPPAQVVGRAG